MKDFEQAVVDKMAEVLARLGLLHEDDLRAETAIKNAAVRKYYPHSTSHFLGLDVHDAGDYSQPLAAGMVVTCEPGIYISEESIGVRIEDDILITEDGNQVLSAALPKVLA